MKVSDERMIAVLVKYGSQSAAAKELGISRYTITKRLERDDFRARYEEAKESLFNEAVDSMNKCLPSAVATLYNIMKDKDAPYNVRVSAADSILRHSLR